LNKSVKLQPLIRFDEGSSGWRSISVIERCNLINLIQCLYYIILSTAVVRFDQRYNKTNSDCHHRSIVSLICLSCGYIARVPSALGQYSRNFGK